MDMHTVNPELLSKNMDTVLNDAAVMRDKFQQPYILPVHMLLVLLKSTENPGSRILAALKTHYGVDLVALERRVEAAVQAASDKVANLGFRANDGQVISLSRGAMIVLDDALTNANSWNEIHIDTDHILQVMAKSAEDIGRLLREAGITFSRIKAILTSPDNVGSLPHPPLIQRKPPELYFREGVLRDMIAMLTGESAKHLILVGRRRIGKTSLVFSLWKLMLSGNVPEIQGSMIPGVDDSVVDRRKTFQEGLSRAENGILFVEEMYRFFAYDYIAAFGDVTPLIEAAFQQRNPIILATATEEDFELYLANISAITENSHVFYVPEPTVEETVQILKNHVSHLSRRCQFEISDEVLQITAELAYRYDSSLPLPYSAILLLHGAAGHIEAKQENEDTRQHLSLDAETVKAVQAASMGIPIDALNSQSQVN